MKHSGSFGLVCTGFMNQSPAQLKASSTQKHTWSSLYTFPFSLHSPTLLYLYVLPSLFPFHHTVYCFCFPYLFILFFPPFIFCCYSIIPSLLYLFPFSLISYFMQLLYSPLHSLSFLSVSPSYQYPILFLYVFTFPNSILSANSNVFKNNLYTAILSVHS